MKNIFFLFILSFQFLLSQDTSIRIQSSIIFPFQLTLKSLETTVNGSIGQSLFVDSSYTDNDNDQITCKVLRNGNIKLMHTQNNVLRIDVPLKVWVDKQIGKFGLYTYAKTDFELTLSYYLVYTITPDWKLKTKTLQNGYIWNKKPSINISKLEIPLTSFIEKNLNNKLQSYANMIDEQIGKNIDIKKQVISVWNQIQNPTLVSPEYKTWLIMTPLNIEANPFTQDNLAIHSNFKINIISETFVGEAPKTSPISLNIPNLKYTKLAPSDFELYTTVNIPYAEMTAIAQKKFIGDTFSFSDNKYQIKLTDIKLYPQDKNLMIEADMIGSYNGKIYLQGEPYFIDSINMMKLRNIQFEMKTKNILFKLANWLFNGKIEKQLTENFAIPYQDKLEYAKSSSNQSLNQTKNGAKFSGKISEMKPSQVLIFPNQMTLIIYSKGSMKVEI